MLDDAKQLELTAVLVVVHSVLAGLFRRDASFHGSSSGPCRRNMLATKPLWPWLSAGSISPSSCCDAGN